MSAIEKQSIRSFDAYAVRAEFPALKDGFAFLDSAASAQKPIAVIDAMAAVHENHYANVHRGVYQYSQKTTDMFEDARRSVAKFLNAPSENEVIFTRNATESINLVAQTWGRKNLTADDEVILTILEHHANIVPWHILREEIGFTLKVIPILDDGAIDLEGYKSLLSEKTKLVSFSHMSNAIGTILPAQKMTKMAKDHGATVMVDASQAVVHLDIDVTEIGCDFLCFTGHKLYGPTGIGVLWGREDLLNAMPPYQGGGEMIDTVTFDKITYKKAPTRFEAGTPAIVEAIGLGAAIEWLSQFDMAEVRAHEQYLLDTSTKALNAIEGVTIYGTTQDKASILSFTMDGVHPHDVGTIFDQMNVAVRAGAHCTYPLMERFGIGSTVRASFGMYNTLDDVDQLIAAVRKVKSIFG